MLEDFQALRDAGREPQLIIGPWTHTAPELMAAGIRDGLAWLARAAARRRSAAAGGAGDGPADRRAGRAWLAGVLGVAAAGTRDWQLWLGDQAPLADRPSDPADGRAGRVMVVPGRVMVVRAG